MNTEGLNILRNERSEAVGEGRISGTKISLLSNGILSIELDEMTNKRLGKSTLVMHVALNYSTMSGE